MASQQHGNDGDLRQYRAPAGRERSGAVGRGHVLAAWRGSPCTDAHAGIAALKQESGKDILMFGSRALWNDLLAHGLLDELHLMIGPAVLHGGTPIFDTQLANGLQLIDTQIWPDSANVLVRYAVCRQTTST